MLYCFLPRFPLVVTSISQLTPFSSNIVTTFLPVSTAFSTVSCGYFLLFCRFSLCFVQLFLLHASYHFHRFPLWLFVPFPLVSCISCIFNIFFQEFYPSPSVSDRFLHHFLWLLSHFPALSLYFSSMLTASSQFVPSSRSGFLHVPTDFAPFILVVITFSCQVVITFSFTVSFQHFPVDFARFPLIVIMFSCSFYILFVGFQSIHACLIYFSKIFARLLFAPFPLVCCIFNIFFQEFYPSPSFSDRFCTIFLWLLSHFPALSLSFSNMFTASSQFVPSSHSGFLHVPTDFAWLVPQHFPLIVIMFSSSFIVFSNTSSSWVFNMFCPAFFNYMFPIIFTSFLHQVFAPFPLVSCIFIPFQYES